MIIWGHDNIPYELRGSVIALGNFDGVHIGHQEIIKTAVAIARSGGLKVGVLTFDPHPNKVLGKGVDHKLLMNLPVKLDTLLSLGIDFVIIASFTKTFSSLSADGFIQRVLFESLAASHVVTGYNFRFGKFGAGNNKLLAKHSTKLGFSYTQVNHIKYLGLEVSTSRIKTLISTGRINMAARLLGRRHEITGTASISRHLAGLVLSIPTTNVSLDTDLLVPLFGVYLIKCVIHKEDIYWGIANVGIQPTIKNISPPILELFLFDFSGDLYDQDIKISLISFIRPERKFYDLDKLRYAISSDKTFSRYLLKNLNSLLQVS